MLKNQTASAAALATLAAIAIGFGWIIEGVVTLVETGLVHNRGLSILSGVLSIVAGIAVFMFPLESVDLMIVFSGIALAVLGGVRGGLNPNAQILRRGGAARTRANSQRISPLHPCGPRPLAGNPALYRRYTPADLDRLQEILLLRHMGMSVAEIPSALSATEEGRRRTLARHLGTLRTERERLDTLIRTVERTIEHIEKGVPMDDKTKFEGMKRELVEQNERTHAERERLDTLIRTVERTIEHIEKGVPMDDKTKFEGMKRELVEQNERTHGTEVRERWGDTAADEANRKMLKLSEGEFERFQELGRTINESLEAAVRAGAYDQRIARSGRKRECRPHRRRGRTHLSPPPRVARIHLELLHARSTQGPCGDVRRR